MCLIRRENGTFSLDFEASSVCEGHHFLCLLVVGDGEFEQALLVDASVDFHVEIEDALELRCHLFEKGENVGGDGGVVALGKLLAVAVSHDQDVEDVLKTVVKELPPCVLLIVKNGPKVLFNGSDGWRLAGKG